MSSRNKMHFILSLIFMQFRKTNNGKEFRDWKKGWRTGIRCLVITLLRRLLCKNPETIYEANEEPFSKENTVADILQNFLRTKGE